MFFPDLVGKVAIVTGATRKRGLGRAIVLCLAHAGADVVVTRSGKKPGRVARTSFWDGQAIAML
jgi:NAD(P)-dependent dehydrogenase (short-subunit alcohol dehydrogenase family)